MLSVTLRQITESSVALQRLAENAKLPTTLFFRVLRIWKEIKTYLQTFDETRQVCLDSHREYVDRIPGDSSSGKDSIFKSLADEMEYRAEIKRLLAESVEVNAELVPWKLIDTMIKDKKLEVSPADLVALSWLIELPGEDEA
jgi:hypothetical protein